MNSKHINSQINQIKGYGLIYAFVTASLFSIFKIIMYGFIYQIFLADLYLFTVTIGIFIIIIHVKKHHQHENIDLIIRKIYKIGYPILIIGGLWVHFFASLILPLDTLIFGYIVNSLILIGFIAYSLMLRKNKLYANYESIDKPLGLYYKRVFRNVAKVVFMFSVILGSILLIEVIFEIMRVDLRFFISMIVLSCVMVSVEYIIFAIYEKHHYDESILSDSGHPRLITRNSVLIFSAIYGFQIISSFVTLKYGFFEIQGHALENPWEIYEKLLLFSSVDFALMRLVMMLIVYMYVKKIVGMRLIIKMVFANALLSFAVTMTNFLISIWGPILAIGLTTPGDAIGLGELFTYVELGFSVVFLGYISLIVYNLYRHHIMHYKLTMIYVAILIAFNPFVLLTLFDGQTKGYLIATFIGVVVKGFVLLMLYLLFSHKQVDLDVSHHEVLT